MTDFPDDDSFLLPTSLGAVKTVYRQTMLVARELSAPPTNDLLAELLGTGADYGDAGLEIPTPTTGERGPGRGHGHTHRHDALDGLSSILAMLTGLLAPLVGGQPPLPPPPGLEIALDAGLGPGVGASSATAFPFASNSGLVPAVDSAPAPASAAPSTTAPGAAATSSQQSASIRPTGPISAHPSLSDLFPTPSPLTLPQPGTSGAAPSAGRPFVEIDPSYIPALVPASHVPMFSILPGDGIYPLSRLQSQRAACFVNVSTIYFGLLNTWERFGPRSPGGSRSRLLSPYCDVHGEACEDWPDTDIPIQYLWDGPTLNAHHLGHLRSEVLALTAALTHLLGILKPVGKDQKVQVGVLKSNVDGLQRVWGEQDQDFVDWVTYAYW